MHTSGEVLPEQLGGGVQPTSQNPYPIYDKPASRPPLSHVRERRRARRSGGKSLVKRCQESEPALISVIFSFLLRQSEVKYH